MAIDLPALRAGLAGYSPKRLPFSNRLPYAAVSAVFRDAPAGLELLLIVRAQRDGDPWSGNVALPGGLSHPDDPDAEFTARRETEEEVGLVLGEPLARGREILAMTPRGKRPMAVVPWVFALPVGGEPAPQDHEVDDVLWATWARLTDPAERRPYRKKLGPVTFRFASVSLGACEVGEERVLWGLTLRMIDDLAAALQP